MNPTWIYIAALYAIAVWLARRGGVALPWRIAALFYALVLIFLFRPMTQGYVNVPVDYLQNVQPWGYLVRHAHFWNGELNDVTMQMLPWAHQVREAWRSLHVPLWNARAGSGYPLLANGQSAALSPLRLLALPLSLGYSFTAEAAMKFLIALTFTYLFCRRRGWSDLASTVGAISFGFCSFIVIWLHYPHSTVASFLPAVMYALDLLAERITYRRFVFAAVVWAILLLGGHPETAAHIFSFALLAVAWIVLAERPFTDSRESLRFVFALGGALAVAALLSSPAIAPLAEALTKSQRFQQVKANPPEPHPFSEYRSTIILFEPHFYGEPPIEQPWGPEVAESITGFAGILGAAGWIALLIDSIVRRRFRSREMFFVVGTLLVLGVILGWPVIAPAFEAALSMAANARMRLVLCFVMAIQGAALVDMLERRIARPVLIGLFLIAAGLFALMTFVPLNDWQRDGTLLGILPSMFVIGLAAIAVTAVQRWRPAVLMLLVVAVISEIWAASMSWNPVLPEWMMFPRRSHMIATLEKLRDAAPPSSFRIVGTGPMLFPNMSAMFGIDDIRAHDPMANGRYLGMMRVLAGYTVFDYFAMWNDIDTPLLDFLNVRYVLTHPGNELGDNGRYRLAYDGPDGRIFENRNVLPRFFPVPVVVLEFNGEKYVRRLLQQRDWAHTGLLKKLDVENDRERNDLLAPRPAGSPQAKLTMVTASDTEYRMRITAPRYSLVVSSIPWWPGWKVERNGERTETLQVNGPFVGFVVRPGVTDVRVHFSSTTFNVAATMALLTIVVLVALSSGSLRRRLPGLRQSE